MRPRAIICDVYRTILGVHPPVADQAQGWERLWGTHFGGEPPLAFAGFSAGCRAKIAELHAESRAVGIAFPEVQWPLVVQAVCPEFATLPPDSRRAFLLAGQALERCLAPVPGAVQALSEWAREGRLLGIASNAQQYTLDELAAALEPAGLKTAIFAPDLSLWSWQLGFSKPDPYFFHVLTARLTARGIAPDEALMVGDRVDNDIAPARSAGFIAWHLHPRGDGGWDHLRAAVSEG